MKKPIFMETTQISAEQTAGEICSLLVRSGARQIASEYKDGKIIGVRFVLPVGAQEFVFELPARTDALFLIFKKRNPYGNVARMREQAERTGWRQLLRWTQAQLAFIESGMVQTHEVFLPYLIDIGGRTVFQSFQEQKFKALPERTQ